MSNGLEQLDEMFDSLLKKFPKAKKELMEDVGDEMHNQVIKNIDSNVGGEGKEKQNLKNDVKIVVGSKGGYVAVKPSYEHTNLNHLIEDGHRIIRKGQVVGWANGKHMYRNALDQVADKVEKMAEDMIDELVGEIDG